MDTIKISFSLTLPSSRLWLPLPGPFGVALDLSVPQFLPPMQWDGNPLPSVVIQKVCELPPHPGCSTADKVQSSESVPLPWLPLPSPGPHVPSLPQQSEQPTQKVRVRTSLGAMAQAGSAFRGWGREHPRAGKGLRSHPGESPAPSRGPLLPLPLLTHCLVHGAPEEEPPVPSPATASLGCGRPQRWGPEGGGHEREKW